MRTLYLLGSFFAGFSLMTFEILASRLLAPIVGNSIYSWSSIIGIIILGLAFGSFVGGLIADKFSNRNTLGFSFGLSSMLVVLTIVLSNHTSFLSLNTDILLASLFVSLYLLCLPSISIGTILPIILKLYFKNISNLGQEYGLLSAMWSLGSILGVFITGFFLISTIGSMETLLSVAIILFIFSFIFFENKREKVVIIFILFNIVFLSFSVFYISSKNLKGNVIFEKETRYYLVKIARTDIFGESKILFLDFDSHSIVTKNSMGKIYTDIYPIFRHINENMERILVVGAGAYNLPISMKNHYPSSKVEVVELDSELENIGIEFFGLNPEDITTHTKDARIYIKETQEKYDIIFGDAYNSFISVPWHLLTHEFNENVKDKLKEDGVYALNFIGSVDGEKNELYKSIVKTFEKSFPNYYTFVFGNNSFDVQNIVLVGLKNKENYLDIETLKNKISGDKYGIALAQNLISNQSVEEGVLLTDNFAPVEKMMIKPMKEYFQSYLKNYNYLINM